MLPLTQMPTCLWQMPTRLRLYSVPILTIVSFKHQTMNTKVDNKKIKEISHVRFSEKQVQ